MIPYGGLYFFYILFILLIPAVFLGVNEKPLKKYGLLINIVILILVFGDSRRQSISLLLFYIGELILIKLYLLIRKKHSQRWILWIVVFLSLTPLILEKINGIYSSRIQISFLGISYLTFKTVQMLLEIYDGLISEVNIINFTYFLLFFPTISSGPIDRSRRFEQDINRVLTRQEYSVYLREGIWKIATGIAYKFIIGALISSYWMNKIPEVRTFMNIVNYMYSYSFYLFFDFAGYSLIAIGTSYILGVASPENFNMPFISKDIKDFWNRWHMSLSFWFRDFLYTRFVMAALKKRWFKSRFTASYLGYIITMGTMGLWHGTHIMYIIYGIYHAFLIIITDYIERKSKWYKRAKKSEGWSLLFTFITFNLVCFGFLIFSGYLIKK